MAKLKLNLDALLVESFVAADAPAGGGTVDAYAVKPSVTCETSQETCVSLDCPEDPSDNVTCDATCHYSCYNSCHFTCEVFSCQFTCHPGSPC